MAKLLVVIRAMGATVPNLLVHPDPVMGGDPVIHPDPVMRGDPVIRPNPVIRGDPVIHPNPMICPDPVVCSDCLDRGNSRSLKEFYPLK